MVDAPTATDLVLREGSVEFRDVSFAYERGLSVLKGVSGGNNWCHARGAAHSRIAVLPWYSSAAAQIGAGCSASCEHGNAIYILSEAVEKGSLTEHWKLGTAPTVPALVCVHVQCCMLHLCCHWHCPCLLQVSFSAPGGSTVAFVGATGSGKSTLTRLLFRCV